MYKKNYEQVDVTCILQKTSEIPEDAHLRGSISLTETGLRFEETLPVKRSPRNPKLYEGQHLSVVRKVNGSFQCHLKTLKSTRLDAVAYAGEVYKELIEAFHSINN